MNRMLRRWKLVMLGSLLVSGCVPDGLPAYVNGGKTIVATTYDQTQGGTLWTYDVATGKAVSHPIAGWKLGQIRMLGGQIWTEWYRGETPQNYTYASKLFDPIKNEFVDAPKELDGKTFLSDALLASHEGKKCLFLPGETADDRKTAYDVHVLPELKKITTVSLDKVLSADGFRYVVVREKEKTDALELDEVDIYSQEGKKVLTIQHEQASKMPYIPGKFRGYALINEAEKVLLLAFGDGGVLGFGVFDTDTGKFLWGGKTTHLLTGVPVLKRNEIWSFDGDDRDENNRLTLVRRTPGEKADECKREVTMLERWSGVSGDSGQYTPSPDGTHFVMVGSNRDGSTQLLFIPIKKDVTEKDIKAVELVAAPAPAKPPAPPADEF